MERCGAVENYRTRNREVAGSIPANTKCCVLETLYPHNVVLVSSREDPAYNIREDIEQNRFRYPDKYAFFFVFFVFF